MLFFLKIVPRLSNLIRLYGVLYLFVGFIAGCGNLAGVASITFSPVKGAVGTLVTVTGTGVDFSKVTSAALKSSSVILVNQSASSMQLMIMPGAASGTISVETSDKTYTAKKSFTVTEVSPVTTQQGTKFRGSGAVGNNIRQGRQVALSADGNTAIVGVKGDDSGKGAAWIFVREEGAWSQQGEKLIGSDAANNAGQGISVALSADGNTAIVGGIGGGVGASWVFTRSQGVWTQQAKLVATGGDLNTAQGYAVSLSADGNTALIGGPYFDNARGVAFIFTRTNGVWAQQAVLLGSNRNPLSLFGSAVALSSDGQTAVLGGASDDSEKGAAWVFKLVDGAWTQQGSKLLGSGAVGNANQGTSVAINADGTTLLVGGPSDDTNKGAVWVFTLNNGSWVQQGAKLRAADAPITAQPPSQGTQVGLSADGNTAIIGGPLNNLTEGAAWIFTRTDGTWSQSGSSLVGSGATGKAQQGWGAYLSSDGTTAIVGGTYDDSSAGAMWVFVP